MDFQVGLTDEAIADLGSIAEFIARDSAEAAERVGLELLATAESLRLFPNRGVAVKGRSDMRKIFRWSYAIYYRVKVAERRVEVLRIWDVRQDPMKLKLP
jgi:toxin ParE1/3/4